ncbi:MAG: CrcB family protein [Acidobacteriota bacterium]
MGGFTTYSTFNYETTNYFRTGAWLMGATNVVATFAGCLIASLVGMALAKILVR